MRVTRTFRMLAGGLTAGLLIGAFGATAAEARPVKPGAVTGLQAQVTPGASGSYAVAATWDAVANATSYRASITKAGATLASATVKTTSWNPTLTTSPGIATLSVKAVISHRAGRASSISVPLPDVTAPTGSFSSSWVNSSGLATITQDSLTDDSPVAQVTRTVDWGDGTVVAWTTGTQLTHTYPLTAQRYAPTVTLEDAAHNVRVVDVPAIVINDLTAPTGSFSSAPGTGWANLTAVTVSQSALSDDWSPADKIRRSVDWGDGSVTSNWSAANTIAHVYTVAGTFSPTVTITDEAGNATQVATSQVVVTADTTAPVVKLLLPKTHRHSVKAWKTLRGTATDAAGTGVKRVSLKAVEKRGTHWYGYRPATKTWARAATKRAAFKKSRAFSLTTTATHAWSAKLVGLRKGTLVYKVKAVDRVQNSSAPLTHKARLTKP